MQADEVFSGAMFRSHKLIIHDFCKEIILIKGNIRDLIKMF